MFLTFHADLFMVRRAKPLRSAALWKDFRAATRIAGLLHPPLLMPRPTTGASHWEGSAAHLEGLPDTDWDGNPCSRTGSRENRVLQKFPKKVRENLILF